MLWTKPSFEDVLETKGPKNKWVDWNEHWFYFRVCDVEAVQEAALNNLPKAHVLVSVSEPMNGLKQAERKRDTEADLRAAEAYDLTSSRQISRDLVEEMIALDQWLLSSEVHFGNIVEKDGYKGPEVVLARPTDFDSDEGYIREIERLANQLCDPYNLKEHEGKIRKVGNLPRKNRVFEAMGISCPERVLSSRRGRSKEGDIGAAGTSGRGRGARASSARGRGGRRVSASGRGPSSGHKVSLNGVSSKFHGH